MKKSHFLIHDLDRCKLSPNLFIVHSPKCGPGPDFWTRLELPVTLCAGGETLSFSRPWQAGLLFFVSRLIYLLNLCTFCSQNSLWGEQADLEDPDGLGQDVTLRMEHPAGLGRRGAFPRFSSWVSLSPPCSSYLHDLRWPISVTPFRKDSLKWYLSCPCHTP